MVKLEKNLQNLHEIVLKISSEIEKSSLNQQNADEVFKEVENQLRRLNFEANEFFENLDISFDVNNTLVLDIVQIVSEIVKNSMDTFRGVSFSLLNFSYFLVTHLLFLLSSQDLDKQTRDIPFFNNLLDEIVLLEQVPHVVVQHLEDKRELDDYLRLLGSAGDLFYLACTNLQKINKDQFIHWSLTCLQQFKLLEDSCHDYDSLQFHLDTGGDSADLYRDLVSYYTIIGNSNATNLFEQVLSLMPVLNIKQDQIQNNYISEINLNGLLEKLHDKKRKLHNIISKTESWIQKGLFFTSTDKPLENISYKLIMAMEKYFSFTIAKLKAYNKEWKNPSQKPSSIEVTNALHEGKNWLDFVIALTVENENILDTPFGGLFNSLLLEYILLLALNAGKKEEEINSLEEALEDYGSLYMNKEPHISAEFMFMKTYALIYTYALFQKKEKLLELTGQLKQILPYVENQPFVKLDCLFLLLIIQKGCGTKENNLVDLMSEIDNLLSLNALNHVKEDLLNYKKYITEDFPFPFNEEGIFLKKNPIDVRSWLVPNITNIKFVSFHREVNKFFF